MTREFLEVCREKMTADGVFVMNINSALDGPLAGIFQSMYRTIHAVFPNTYVFAADYRNLDQHAAMNIIFVATKQEQPISPEQWAARAARHQSDSYVKSEDLRRMVEDLRVDPPDVASAPIFSDDYAPIETMAF